MHGLIEVMAFAVFFMTGLHCLLSVASFVQSYPRKWWVGSIR